MGQIGNGGAGLAGRSVKRGRRRFVSLLTVGVAALVAVAFTALDPIGGARAASPNFVQVSPGVPATAGVAFGDAFFDREVAIGLFDGGTVWLSGSANGLAPYNADDSIIIDITHPDGTTATYSHFFVNDDCTQDIAIPPTPLVDSETLLKLTTPGNNIFRVRLFNVCGPTGAADPTYLVVKGQPTDLRLSPVVAEIASGNPPLVTAFPLNLTGKLTETASHNPIEGRTVAFSSGGSVICTALTDADGVATCGGLVEDLTAILGLGIDGTFVGDPYYLGDTDHEPLILLGGQPILPV
jgi:hypothetical protein